MKRDENLLVRLSEPEKKGFELAAELSGISLSAWARERLRSSAISELQQTSVQIPFLKPIPLRKTENGT